MKKYSLCIIGGGAAGLACGVTAAKAPDCSILVLDRMPKAGKKLLVTGNGRCNLSSTNISEKHYHGSVKIKELIKEIPDVRPFFEELGLFSYCDDMGRIYPLTNTAASVNDALRFNLLKRAEIITNAECTEIVKEKDGFTVTAGDLRIAAQAAVLACGGSAAPVQGSNGSGFDLARSLGLEIEAPYPALCPLYCGGTKGLEGVRAKCRAELIHNGKLVKFEYGEVQFTKNGLSGICIFNLSAAFKEGNYIVSLDLMPDITQQELVEIMKKAVKSRPELEAQDCFNGVFSRPLTLYLLKKAGIKQSKLGKALTDTEIKHFAAISKHLDFTISGRAGFDAAQVTAGGVKGSEIDNNFMSRKINGLFLAGEILDIWGDCGGYNLHFAFASGIKAGESALSFIKREQAERNTNR